MRKQKLGVSLALGVVGCFSGCWCFGSVFSESFEIFSTMEPHEADVPSG